MPIYLVFFLRFPPQLSFTASAHSAPNFVSSNVFHSYSSLFFLPFLFQCFTHDPRQSRQRQIERLRLFAWFQFPAKHLFSPPKLIFEPLQPHINHASLWITTFAWKSMIYFQTGSFQCNYRCFLFSFNGYSWNCPCLKGSSNYWWFEIRCYSIPIPDLFRKEML